MRYAANLNLLWRDRPFLDRFAAAREAGFEAVEFPFLGEHDPHDVAERLVRNDLQLALFNTAPGDVAAGDWGTLGDPLRCERFREIFDRTLEHAELWRCTRVHALFGKQVPEVTREAQIETAIENLAWALPRARAAGVTLTLEPLNEHEFPGYFLSTTELALQVVRRVGDASLRLQFDVYHLLRAGENLELTLEAAGPFLGHVQIADMPGRCDPGFGQLDFARLFGRLQAHGYDGWIGLEYHPQHPPEQALRKLRALSEGARGEALLLRPRSRESDP